MVKPHLLSDPLYRIIALQQQQLGLLDPVALQVGRRRAAEDLLHAAGDIDRMKVDARRAAWPRTVPCSAPLNTRRPAPRKWIGGRSVHADRGGQEGDHFLKQHLLSQLGAGDMQAPVQIGQLRNGVAQLLRLNHLRKLRDRHAECPR